MEEERGDDLPGAIASQSESRRDKFTSELSFGGNMILEDVPEDFGAGVGSSLGLRTVQDANRGSIRDRSYGIGAVRIAMFLWG